MIMLASSNHMHIIITLASSPADKFRKPSKRDTPEKPGTPSASQENLLEDGSTVEKKYVIVNDEILALRIKQEDLQKVAPLVTI